MAVNHNYSSGAGSHILRELVLAGTQNRAFTVSLTESLSLQLDFSGTGLTTAVTLWASNHANPDAATDTAWVDITASVNGIPTITTLTGTDVSMVTVPRPFSASLHYKLKLVTSAGTGTLDAFLCQKQV